MPRRLGGVLMPTAMAPLGTESFNFDVSTADDDDCCPATCAFSTGATFLPLLASAGILVPGVGRSCLFL